MSRHKLNQYNFKYEIRLKKQSYIISKICINLRVFIKNLLYYIIIYLYIIIFYIGISSSNFTYIMCILPNKNIIIMLLY
jgi:hypothetical protein